MSTAVRLVGNNTNRVRTAVLSASTQLPSTDLRLTAQTRTGGGDLALVGPYTGAADTVVDVEVLSGTGTALRPSLPVLAGVGSGTLTVLTVDAAAVPETWTLKLVAAGTAATAAQLPFYGVLLRAKTTGTAGNGLTLTVTPRLTLTPTDWSTLTEIAAGTADFDGQQWNWGAAPAVAEEIPASAPRLAFAEQVTVYRHWRAWSEGTWVYHLDPPPAAAVAAGTRVLTVTGDYRLTLSDGTTTEVIDAITIHDALTQWAARSNLIDVVGTVAADTAPGGMAVTDIPLRTDAYALPVSAQLQGAYGVPRLDGLSVAPSAPTEIITVERQAAGGWTVQGSVSGALATARTAVPYQAGPLGFTIPAALVPAGDDAGITAAVRLTSRPPEETKPALCVTPQLGAAAVPRSVTFVYTARPAGTCSCADVVAPHVSPYCLGFGGEDDDMTYPAAVTSRLDTVYAWRTAFVRANTRWVSPEPARSETVGGSPGTPGQYRVRAQSAITYNDGSNTHTYTFTGTSTQTFSTSAAAQQRASAVSGASGGSWMYQTVTVGGVTLNLAGMPSPFISQWITGSYSWSAVVETLVAGVDGVAGTVVNTAAVPAHWQGATQEFQAMDTVLDLLLPTLVQVADHADALAAWDALWADAQAEMDVRLRTTADDDHTPAANTPAWFRRYAAACDTVRIAAGIYPSFDDASPEAGGCWRDDPSASYWWVDAAETYLPAFTGQGYTACKRLNGVVVATREFGFGLAVACPGSLKEGDQFTITVSGASADGYTAGDRYQVPLVAAAAAPFGGGATGDATLTWAVQGSVSGATPDWAWLAATPTDYTAGLVGLRLAAGGIPFAVGDTWTADLEGGALRWRREAGAWTTADLFGTAPNLGNGLALAIQAGAAPSFVAGDTWTFAAAAVHGPGQVRQPREGQAWAWSGATATLTLDLGAVCPLEVVLLALHTLPTGTGITLRGGVAAATEWTATLTQRAGPILHVLPAATTARYLSLALSNVGAAGASIGWLWVGVPWTPTVGPSAMTRTHQYQLTRGAGLNPRGVYRGRGQGARWTWSLDESAPLLAGDVSGLVALLDHVAAQGAEWIALVPNLAAPATVALAQIETDAVTLTEYPGCKMADGTALVSVDLPFRAVLA
ncbi:hypothetical protein [uncultured Lamprocystis sp.]|jgi:hypothetical protein|uniref:hypothetical protein n=1 Tax=uncultured Lamprocystis sp. TaxID=543132 RepID=UPI0025E7EFE6|nr:hypothetical protein [uncultured Lamprocystis sp.]